MADRIIDTGLTGPIQKDILASVLGQLSDGWWENSNKMDPYWKNASVDEQGGLVILIIKDVYPYSEMSDEKIKQWFAQKIKFLIKREFEDNPKAWRRINTKDKTVWLSHADPSETSVADCYYTYDTLMGRNTEKKQYNVIESKFDSLYNKIISEGYYDKKRYTGDWDDYGEARYPGERYNGEKWRSRAWSRTMNEYWDNVREQRRKLNAQIKQDREAGFQNIPITLRDTWRAWWDFYSFSCRVHNFSQIYEKLPTVQSFESELDKSRAKLVPGANVNLAIKGYKDMEPKEDLLLFPYAIIDKVEDGIVLFHIDPKKYRELKELNYQVKITNVELRYLQLHPLDQEFKNAHPFGDSLDKSNTTGILLKKLYNLWYKVYGKEQGQLFHFRVPLKGVAVYEDVIALWDNIIKEYLEAKDKSV